MQVGCYPGLIRVHEGKLVVSFHSSSLWWPSVPLIFPLKDLPGSILSAPNQSIAFCWRLPHIKMQQHRFFATGNGYSYDQQPKEEEEDKVEEMKENKEEAEEQEKVGQREKLCFICAPSKPVLTFSDSSKIPFSPQKCCSMATTVRPCCKAASRSVFCTTMRVCNFDRLAFSFTLASKKIPPCRPTPSLEKKKEYS